jgi:hypothetical protein
VAFIESPDDFLRLKSDGGLADPATYDGATAVAVLFDAAYLDTLGMAATNPVALGKATDFPAAAVGKTLLIGSTTYTIRNRQPQDDGTGPTAEHAHIC